MCFVLFFREAWQLPAVTYLPTHREEIKLVTSLIGSRSESFETQKVLHTLLNTTAAHARSVFITIIYHVLIINTINTYLHLYYGEWIGSYLHQGNIFARASARYPDISHQCQWRIFWSPTMNRKDSAALQFCCRNIWQLQDVCSTFSDP